MKKKGAGKKGFLLVVFAAFISTSVWGEGKNVDGYSEAVAQIGFLNAEFSDADPYYSEPQAIENIKPPLAMTTALKFDEPQGAYLRFSVAPSKGVSPYVSPYIVTSVVTSVVTGRATSIVTDRATSVTGASQWTRSDIEAAAGNESYSEGDVSYGIGAEFNLAEDAKINVEYRDYIRGSKNEESGFSFGASWTF